MDDLTPTKKEPQRPVHLLGILCLRLGYLYIRYYYVFATGVKSGELNYLTYKGIIFKPTRETGSIGFSGR